jgi:transcriptional regulator with XRE-family HTH domain
MSGAAHNTVECETCHGTPRADASRIITVTSSGAGATITWHTPDCPRHAADTATRLASAGRPVVSVEQIREMTAARRQQIRENVGQRLLRRRRELEMTQEAVARAAGVTVTTVGAAENGRNVIRVSRRAGWETALHLAPGAISRSYREDTELETVAPDAGRGWEQALGELGLNEQQHQQVLALLHQAAGRKP